MLRLLFYFMSISLRTFALQEREASFSVLQERISKGTGLNILQYIAHSLASLFGDHLRTSQVIAIFSGVEIDLRIVPKPPS